MTPQQSKRRETQTLFLTELVLRTHYVICYFNNPYLGSWLKSIMFKVKFRFIRSTEFILCAVIKVQEIAGHAQKRKNTSTPGVGGIAWTERYVYDSKGS